MFSVAIVRKAESNQIKEKHFHAFLEEDEKCLILLRVKQKI